MRPKPKYLFANICRALNLFQRPQYTDIAFAYDWLLTLNLLQHYENTVFTEINNHLIIPQHSKYLQIVYLDRKDTCRELTGSSIHAEKCFTL